MYVINAHTVQTLLNGAESDVCEIVRQTYHAYEMGEVVNPQSAFLRFPHQPDARIIALPGHLGGHDGVSGIKWIASYPGNVAQGRPRASAVMILNSARTGEPFALLEASAISAARTAASAVLGAQAIGPSERRVRRLGIIGTGPIAGQVAHYLGATGWRIDGLRACDLDGQRAHAFAQRMSKAGWTVDGVDDTPADTLSACDLVVFATSATQPYLDQPGLLAHRPAVLHMSLRDLSPAMILAADNVTDDVDHVLSAQTSLHLAEQRIGHRRFVNGTLDRVSRGEVSLSRDRPRIFSPFGLGVLDVAVAHWLCLRAVEQGRAIVMSDFLPVAGPAPSQPAMVPAGS